MFTQGNFYALKVTGAGHGYCNAQFFGQMGQKLYFQPFNNLGEKHGSLVTIYADSIEEVVAR